MTHKAPKYIKLSHFIAALVIISVFIAGGNYYVYYELSNLINDTKTNLSRDISETQKSLEIDISEVSVTSANERKNLEDKTFDSITSLQEIIDQETSKINSDLRDIEIDTKNKIEDLNSELGGLENRVSDLDVSSESFSGIIEDVVKAVVSVRTDTGVGSGVFVNRDGYIVTNKHVIEDAKTIQVTDFDGDSYGVTVLGIARNVDIAVLKVNGNFTFDYLKFEDSDDVKIGSRVIAVGNPLGLSFSVTEGIVSATDRTIDSSGVGFVQTDVSINPGNSGGPLVNSNMEIVGINTLKISDTEGLGFAIPSDVVEGIIDQAIG